MAQLTSNQISALIFNLNGRGSESRNFFPYQLNWAQIGSSGVSIGYLQWDFGVPLSGSDVNSLSSQNGLRVLV
jgi:hypothetical protein